MQPYRFRPVATSDTVLLRGWRGSRHWVRWWGAFDPDDDFPADVLAEPPVRPWIVEREGQPIAYLQDYDPHGWPDHHFGHLPPGTRGIDQSIGPAALLGQGHGPAFIRQHAARLFAEGAAVIATDPHPDNDRAIRAYRKAGFEVAGEPIDTEWGLCVPMLCWRDQG